MDQKTSLSLAVAIGLVGGFAIGHFFGNQLAWIFFGLVFAIATEITVCTIRNTKAGPGVIKNAPSTDNFKNLKDRPKKPPSP